MLLIVPLSLAACHFVLCCVLCFEALKRQQCVVMLLIVPLSLAACHSLFSDPAPPRLTQPLSSRLFLAREDDEGDCDGGGDEGGGGDDDGGGDEGDGDEDDEADCGGGGDADYEKN